jgi:hypothetical protein
MITLGSRKNFGLVELGQRSMKLE